MPFINIKFAQGEKPASTAQKAKLIAGATDLVAKVLGKNPATTVVFIEELAPENVGVGGKSRAALNAAQTKAVAKASKKEAKKAAKKAKKAR